MAPPCDRPDQHQVSVDQRSNLINRTEEKSQTPLDVLQTSDSFPKETSYPLPSE
jgi:hypothetical protein